MHNIQTAFSRILLKVWFNLHNSRDRLSSMLVTLSNGHFLAGVGPPLRTQSKIVELAGPASKPIQVIDVKLQAEGISFPGN